MPAVIVLITTHVESLISNFARTSSCKWRAGLFVRFEIHSLRRERERKKRKEQGSSFIMLYNWYFRHFSFFLFFPFSVASRSLTAWNKCTFRRRTSTMTPVNVVTAALFPDPWDLLIKLANRRSGLGWPSIDLTTNSIEPYLLDGKNNYLPQRSSSLDWFRFLCCPLNYASTKIIDVPLHASFFLLFSFSFFLQFIQKENGNLLFTRLCLLRGYTQSESYNNKVKRTKEFQKKKIVESIDTHWNNSHKLNFSLLLTKV